MKFARILKHTIIFHLIFFEWVLFGPGPTCTLMRPGPRPRPGGAQIGGTTDAVHHAAPLHPLIFLTNRICCPKRYKYGILLEKLLYKALI